MKLRQYIIFSSLLFVHYYSFGQFPGNNRNSSSTNTNTGADNYVPEPDTFGVFYFLLDNPYQEWQISDTTITNFQTDRLTLNRDFEYADLGNQGSAYQAMFFQPQFRRGIDIGLHQFDMYQLTKNNTPFFRLNKPLSRASYTQYDKKNFTFKGVFSRNFTERLNFSMMTNRSQHEGQFRSQNAKNNAFSSGLWYQSKNKKYEAYLNVTANSNNHVNNGGVDTSKLIVPFINVPVAIDVRRPNDIAKTLHTQRSATYTQYYQLNPRAVYNKIYIPTTQKTKRPNTRNRQSNPIRSSVEKRNQAKNTPRDSSLISNDSMRVQMDSLQIQDSLQTIQDSIEQANYKALYAFNGSRSMSLGHQFSYENSAYRSSDTRPSADFYHPMYYTHQGGLRAFIRHQSITNDFKLSSFKLKKTSTGNYQQRNLTTVGLIHTLNIIKQPPTKTVRNNLFLYGKFDFSPSKEIYIKTYAHYGLMANFSDYRVQGTLSYGLPKLGNLEVALIQQAYSPSWVSESFYVTRTKVWENDFKKIFETNLKATYRLPKYQLELSGQYNLVNNHIYYDTLSTPIQAKQGISIGQVMVKKGIKIWNFHLDNKIILQQVSNRDILRLPRFSLSHSLYFAGYVYKKALYSHIGVDFRMYDEYQGNGYFAMTGQFHLQDNVKNISYPLLDAFVNIRVKQFRLFAKYENIAKLWDKRIYYKTAGHLERYNSFKFGLSWDFLN